MAPSGGGFWAAGTNYLFASCVKKIHALVEKIMTTFDDREKAYEKKFALDQDLKFRSEARRNKMLAEWAAAKLGITGQQIEDYVKAVRRADLEEKGDEDVFRKLRADFDEKGLAIKDVEIREVMGKFLAQAVAEIEASSDES
jgi:hypothetical protein